MTGITEDIEYGYEIEKEKLCDGNGGRTGMKWKK
jgi:hypothetical protein